MKDTFDIKDEYLHEVLCNRSLKDLPGEEWKVIEGFENYMISNYGRLKSLERITQMPHGGENREPEMIMKLILVKQFNKYLNRYHYNIHCSLSSEGKKYARAVARLVYYHFVEKFDTKDRKILISCKDGNRFHLHSSNLETISASEKQTKVFLEDRGRNVRVDYEKAVNQYSIEGDLIASFESIYSADEALGIACESIMDVINKRFLTAGGFRWFLKSDHVKKEDFLVPPKPATDRLLNQSLWKKLGKPPIDKKNPPACMNLSIKDLPGEQWKPIPDFEEQYLISDKGRVKRLANWTLKGRRVFLKEQILSLIMSVHKNSDFYSLYAILRHNERKAVVTITRQLYYSFVEEFDIKGKTLVVVNHNKPLWDINIEKLSLRPIHSVLKKKE
ncbi:NUMOD4 domain-containing protein [Chryseobacterium paridis]|uniref:NUMOD4 domain-containing protein n=1 Tax=Chryseobacterium paridis TaxID=2800328 RepID=A0ABS1FY34_9FLAO|nr:NUMOD4 domain-containing protein [Chryseobacterium paridis]MBK1897305.1 hypothetical protein [Chryseobacterium paridis]